MDQRRRILIVIFVCIALTAVMLAFPVTSDAAGAKVSIRNARSIEGHALSFAVSLSRPASRLTTVDFATTEGTADDSSDFVARAGTLRFRPGESKRYVHVAANTDGQDEPEETMSVTLSRPVRASLGRVTAVGTIEDRNDPPTVSIADAAGNETDGALAFVVTLSAPSGFIVTVESATEDGTAIAGEDYDASSGPITFAPGETTRNVAVALVDDDLVEADETLFVALAAPTNATLSTARAAGTIHSDDVAGSTLSIADATETEGPAGATRPMTFGVTLSPARSDVVTVDYSTAPGTAEHNGDATGSDDYAPVEGSIRFLPGDTHATVSVPVLGDDADEDDETLTVQLASPTNATIDDGEATGTIVDDDAMPSLSINDVAAFERDRGTSDFIFTVTLSAPSGRTVTAGFATSDRTAKAPGDYLTTTGSLTFERGTTSAVVAVPVVGDRRVENREEFLVNIIEAVNATLGRATGVGRIRDDD